MLGEEKETSFYQDLVQLYPFEKRFQHLLQEIQDILERMNVTDEVTVNTDLLGKAIVDYFEDVDRLKRYEGIERINVAKIYAYETFWLVKRSPIQLRRNDLAADFLSINEKVFTCMLLAKMFREAGKSYDYHPAVVELYDLILYNLKYRGYNQKSLELMVTAFLCGCSL